MSKRRNRHILLVLILLVASGVAEAVFTFYYEGLRAQPLMLGSFLQIRPVYNEAGSMFHARLGIGYVNWLLLLEHAVTLIIAAYIYRALELWGYFFRVSQRFLYALDCGIAGTLYRVITRFRGTFTLDYLRVRRSTYDIPDLCIGICVAGMICWIILFLMHYYPYKKEKSGA